MSGEKENSCCTASAVARAPWGLWAASRMHRRGAPDDLEAPWRGDGGECFAHHLGIEPAVEALAAGERLDRGDRAGGVLGLVGAIERQEDLVVRRPEPRHADQLPTDARQSLGHAELEPLAGDGRTHLGDPPEQHLGHVDVLLREHGEAARLDDPRLLDGDLARRVPQQVGVVDPHRGDDRHGRVGHVGDVPAAAEPDLEDRGVDRRVGERRERHRGDRLEERHRDVRRGVDEVDVGGHLRIDLDEPFGRQRSPVDRDALGHRLEMRAREAARAKSQPAKQRVDHP